MAVYTHIDLQTLNALCSQNGIPIKAAKLEGISAGITNSTYLITDDKDAQYILSIQDSQTSNAAFALELAQHLKQCGVSTIQPVTNASGKSIFAYQGKPLIIMHKIPGKCISPDIVVTKEHCRQLGKQIAVFHAATLAMPGETESEFSKNAPPAARLRVGADFDKICEEITRLKESDALESHLERCAERTSAGRNGEFFSKGDVRKLLLLLEESIIKTMNEENAELFNQMSGKLPTAVCHGDLFHGNTIWKGDALEEFSGFVDIWASGRDVAIYDLANALIVWTIHQQDNGKWAIDQEKCSELIQGYINGRKECGKPVTEEEMDILPDMMQASCIQFFAFRLKRLLSPDAPTKYTNILNPMAHIGRMQVINQSAEAFMQPDISVQDQRYGRQQF